MRILLLTKNRSGGGTEKHVGDVVSSLSRRLDISAAYLEDGLWSVRRQTREADIVHCLLPRPYLVGSVLAKRKTVIMSRRSLRSCYQTPLIRRVEERLHKRTKILVGNSPAVVDELREEAPGADIRMIRNGVNFKPLPREKTPCFFIVCVANAFAYKGHADLLAAIRMVGPALPEPWHVILIGSGTEKIKAWRVNGLGWRTDVRSWLGIASLYVQPSHEEGSSNALLEAMAAGVPVIATEVGGNPDAVNSGETGLLVPIKDPHALAEAIRTMANDYGLRTRLAEKAQITIQERFGFERMLDEYEALYRSCSG